MTDDSLARFLNEIGASSDTVQQGLRYYLAEVSDDLPPTHMEQQLLAATDDPPALQSELYGLQRSDAGLEEAALLFLSAAWEDPTQREAVRSALEEANIKLPVIEVAIVSVVAMYGMYLIATGGKSHVKRRTVRAPDGSFVEDEEVQYASPDGWLETLLGLFGGGLPSSGPPQ
jgi:hypothetical protein